MRVAMLDNRPRLDTIEPHARYLALEDIQDPANLGTVIRTAEALGLSACCSPTAAAIPTTPRCSGAAWAGCSACRCSPPGSGPYGGDTGTPGVRCFACVPQGASLRRAGLSAGAVPDRQRGAGPPPRNGAACTGRLTIPMGGRAESLNAAMAAGIVMWELCR